MSLSDHVRILGRGPGRSRSLTQDEAFDAMSLMLRDDAAPEAVGALLMLLRTKGETAQEIAGSSAAAQSVLPAMPSVDIDWPSYAAGRTRGHPWFLLSAKSIANTGRRVIIHGWNGTDPKVRAGLAKAGIGVAATPSDAARLLDKDNIAYLPLEDMHLALFRLLNLRQTLGLRSCVNTVCRMLNPGKATSSVQGVFHPSYRLLQADAAALLGWANLTVIKGGGGEFERHPAKDIAAFGLRDGAAWEHSFPALHAEPRRLAEANHTDWQPTQQSAFDTAIVAGTTALAQSTLARQAKTQAA